MSKIIKPFDIELAKNGARIELQNGNPVRIICYDAVGAGYPLVGLVKTRADCEITDRFAIDDNRLRIVEEVEEPEPWRMSEEAYIDGFFVTYSSTVHEARHCKYEKINRFMFAEQLQAYASIAAAQISQIIANDERFGGKVTEEEWNRDGTTLYSIILKYNGKIAIFDDAGFRTLLSFHTHEQADLFLQEYRDLVEQYFMLKELE